MPKNSVTEPLTARSDVFVDLLIVVFFGSADRCSMLKFEPVSTTQVRQSDDDQLWSCNRTEMSTLGIVIVVELLENSLQFDH